jgi:hypothetical protein
VTIDPTDAAAVDPDYEPPAGSVFVAAGGQTGVLRLNGVQVAVQSSEPLTVVDAAGVLSTMPR